MIDEQRTLEIYGYTSDELSPKNGNRIVAVCDECGKYRTPRKYSYRDLCNVCARNSPDTIEKNKKNQPDRTGSNNPNYGKGDKTRGSKNSFWGKKHSDETKLKMRKNQPDQTGSNNPNYGNHKKRENPKIVKFLKEHKNKHLCGCGCGLYIPIIPVHYKKGIPEYILGHNNKTEEGRRLSSCIHQGIPLSEWDGYVTDNPYCDKFNESCKEHNREKYGNQCFICGKTKEENSNRALSVHHVTKNKMEGCDGSKWQLIPLCGSCHSKAHHEPLQSRINFLLG